MRQGIASLLHPKPNVWRAEQRFQTISQGDACSIFTGSTISTPHPTSLALFFFFTLVTGPRRSLSLKLSDARVYDSQIRARLAPRTPNPNHTLAQGVGGRARTLHPDPPTLNPEP